MGYRAYRARGGYQLAAAVVQGETPADEVLAALEASGLRGLGGAGFAAARKWRIVREQPAPRLMAVNIDEGEPGTFKDRTYLERDPHRFLEGVLLAAQVLIIHVSKASAANITKTNAMINLVKNTGDAKITTLAITAIAHKMPRLKRTGAA